MDPVKRRTTVVLGVCLLLTAKGVGGQEFDPIGCYDFHLGAWSPELEIGADSLYLAPPPRIALGRNGGARNHDREHGNALEAAPGVIPSVHRVRFWELDERGIVLLWSNGFSGMRVHLERVGETDGLAGTARSFWDHGREEQVAEVNAEPVLCDAPVPEEHRIRYVHLRGVAPASGDSIRIGESLPAALELHRESENVLVYRGELAEPFSGAEEVQIWAPEGVVREVRIRFTSDRSFADVVRDMVAVLGEPTSRSPEHHDRVPGLQVELAAWTSRMMSIGAHGGSADGVPSPVLVMLRDPHPPINPRARPTR